MLSQAARPKLRVRTLGWCALLGLAAACAREALLDSGGDGAAADGLGRVVESSWVPIWLDEPLAFSGPAAAPATLIRFWTDDCPYCEASLPALEKLREEFGSRGLATLAIYHPKPPRRVPAAQIRTAALTLGYHGPLAADLEWKALERIWLSGRSKSSATSASFLLDRAGRIRFIHPGPLFHPSEEDHDLSIPAEEAGRDFDELRAAITALLAEEGT